MYLWVGCKLPDDFESEIRQRCLMLNQEIGLNTVAFDLPQHISLKISFPTNRSDEVLDALAAFLADQQPFSVRLLPALRSGSVIWLPAEENICLRQIHAQLDRQLEARFGIPQHEFDKCFLFHSTLFMDADPDKLTRMERLLAGYPAVREMWIDTFLLGQSETGKPGSYRVVQQITV